MVAFDQKRLADICRRNDLTRLRLFGSTSRGEERPESDIDLIVDFGAPKGFFELIRLEDELQAVFDRQVDLVTEPGLSPDLRRSILASAYVIFDSAA
jgi:predicted nucleotidyltransferase